MAYGCLETTNRRDVAHQSAGRTMNEHTSVAIEARRSRRWYGLYPLAVVLAVSVGGCTEPGCPDGLVRSGSMCVRADVQTGAETTGGVDGGVPDAGPQCVVSVWYLDYDQDGAGDDRVTVEACDGPTGYAVVAGDCDDGDAARHPGQTEVCNGVDDDCDGAVDEGFECVVGETVACATTCGSTGVGACTDTCRVPVGAACVMPEEVCNYVDDDCDGLVDESVTAARYVDTVGDESPQMRWLATGGADEPRFLGLQSRLDAGGSIEARVVTVGPGGVATEGASNAWVPDPADELRWGDVTVDRAAGYAFVVWPRADAMRVLRISVDDPTDYVGPVTYSLPSEALYARAAVANGRLILAYATDHAAFTASAPFSLDASGLTEPQRVTDPAAPESNRVLVAMELLSSDRPGDPALLTYSLAGGPDAGLYVRPVSSEGAPIGRSRWLASSADQVGIGSDGHGGALLVWGTYQGAIWGLFVETNSASPHGDVFTLGSGVWPVGFLAGQITPVRVGGRWLVPYLRLTEGVATVVEILAVDDHGSLLPTGASLSPSPGFEPAGLHYTTWVAAAGGHVLLSVGASASIRTYRLGCE